MEKNVIFVDDEESMLNTFRRIMTDRPFGSFFASSGREALDLLSKHANEIQVIVTDMRMPGMSGLELLQLVREKYPQIVRIVLSGYTHLPTVLTAINGGEIYRYIAKPWETEAYLLAIILDGFSFFQKRLDLQESLSQESC